MSGEDVSGEDVSGEGVLFGIPDPPDPWQPPDPEGQVQVRRAPGVRAGPYPDVEIVVTATLEQLARALHEHAHPGNGQTAPRRGHPFNAGPAASTTGSTARQHHRPRPAHSARGRASP